MRPADLSDPKVQRVVGAAAATGVEIAPITFERETRTSADAAREIGCEIAEIAKSLVFAVEGTGEPVLLLLSGADQVDLARAAEALGVSSLERADARRAKEATGFSIGATPPFGHTSPLRVAMDDRLLEFGRVWAAGGRGDTVFPIEPGALRRAANVEVHRLRA